MIPFSLNLEGRRDPTILCLGAHSDDVEIGACATILGLAEKYPEGRIAWTVFAASGQREAEARASAEYCVDGFAGAEIRLHAFPDGFFPAEAARLKEVFESLKAECRPDLIFTHYRHDLHQDHRQISDLTWQTFRDHLILEYEVPKYDGDFGTPSLFCPVPAHLHEAKLAALDRFFATQKAKPWFTAEVFSAVMRLRGMECRSPSGYAEAFYCRKAVF